MRRGGHPRSDELPTDPQCSEGRRSYNAESGEDRGRWSNE